MDQPKAGIQVIEIDGVWVVELECKEINFLEREPLPEKFVEFNDEQKKYWSKKIFAKLEKKLARKLNPSRQYYASRQRKNSSQTNSDISA